MRLELNLKVAPTVSPQMILSMNMLQYSAQELEEYLEELSYENPLVELMEQPQDQQQQSFLDRLQWLKNGDRQNKLYYSQGEDWRSDPVAPGEERLEDYLKEQIMLLDIRKELSRAMEVAVDLLTPRGFFDGTAAEVARLSGCGIETAEEALRRLKTLNPVGVGAKDVQESLLLQLKGRQPRNEVAEKLVEQAYSHLASWPDGRLASLIGATKQQVEQARGVISTLSPFPGDGFGSGSTLYVRPDLYVDEEEGELILRASENSLPQLVVNEQYLKMLRSQQDPEVQKYLKGKLGELEQVMRSLNNRKSTMLRCGEIIAAMQQDFFRGGPLRKMTLRDVAEEMGVHESTISRTVRNKYIQCSRGLYEMAYFFSRDAGQNYGVSREHIKERLRQLIDMEDPKKPLSDEKLVEQLARENMCLSRRTVAKYRMELGILSASGRRTQKNVRKSDVYENRTERNLEELV